jgi:hypothetical protein
MTTRTVRHDPRIEGAGDVLDAARAWNRWVPVASLGLLLAQTSRYDWVAITPADAVTLAGDSADPRHAAFEVQQPDGHVVQLSRDFDLSVKLRSGRVLNFSHPVSARVEK